MTATSTTCPGRCLRPGSSLHRTVAGVVHHVPRHAPRRSQAQGDSPPRYRRRIHGLQDFRGGTPQRGTPVGQDDPTSVKGGRDVHSFRNKAPPKEARHGARPLRTVRNSSRTGHRSDQYVVLVVLHPRDSSGEQVHLHVHLLRKVHQARQRSSPADCFRRSTHVESTSQCSGPAGRYVAATTTGHPRSSAGVLTAGATRKLARCISARASFVNLAATRGGTR